MGLQEENKFFFKEQQMFWVYDRHLSNSLGIRSLRINPS